MTYRNLAVIFLHIFAGCDQKCEFLNSKLDVIFPISKSKFKIENRRLGLNLQFQIPD